MTHQPRCGSSAAGLTLFCTVRRSPGESPRQAAFLRSSRHPRCCYDRPRVGPVAASGIASPRARHVSAHGAGWHLEGLQGGDRPAVRRRSGPHAGPCAARLGTLGGRPRGLHALPGLARRRTSECQYLDALVLRRLARHADAAGRFKQALAATPGYLPARVGLAEALFEAGMTTERAGRCSSRLIAEPRSRPGCGIRPRPARRRARAITTGRSRIFIAPSRSFQNSAPRTTGWRSRIERSGRIDGRRAGALAKHAQFGARWPALEDPVRDTVVSASATIRRRLLAARREAR